MSYVKTSIDLFGAEYEVMVTAHARQRFITRMQFCGCTDKNITLEENFALSIADEDVADALLGEVTIGGSAILWDEKNNIIYIVKMELASIIIKTVLETSRHYTYARPEDTCIYVAASGEVTIDKITKSGHFRHQEHNEIIALKAINRGA